MNIKVIDSTEIYSTYGLKRYVLRYLGALPEEDLFGIDKAIIYDDSPPELGFVISGGYSGMKPDGSAEIYLYVGPMLGFMIETTNHDELFPRVMNRVFLVLFGRMFVADAVFHEVGHYRYEVSRPEGETSTRHDEEHAAGEYAIAMLARTFPVNQRYYNFFNWLYKMLYRKRIKRAAEFRRERNRDLRAKKRQATNGMLLSPNP